MQLQLLRTSRKMRTKLLQIFWQTSKSLKVLCYIHAANLEVYNAALK